MKQGINETVKLSCIITDDEPIARRGIQRYVEQIDFLDLVAVCENALQLDAVLREKEADVLFLDINMPQLSGIEFLRNRQLASRVIITTAYPEYALEGYELDVLDYLVKPISFDRFFRAVTRAREFFEATRHPSAGPAPFFFLKCDKRLEKIFPDKILFIESMQNYVRIHLEEDTLIAHLTLKSMQEQLPEALFIQPHRSYLVNLDRVKAVEGNRLVVAEHRVPVSKYQKEEVMEKILGGKLSGK